MNKQQLAQKIWASANQMRSKIEANEYKDYILGFIFYKYLSDSCHSLRHTFTTRMCEAGVNVKVIQDTLGHKDIATTLNIYTDVTKELKRSEFEGLDLYFKNK